MSRRSPRRSPRRRSRSARRRRSPRRRSRSARRRSRSPRRQRGGSRLNRAFEAAEDAFWAQVAAHYPEAESGDFGPYQTLAWQKCAKKAISQWVSNNT